MRVIIYAAFYLFDIGFLPLPLPSPLKAAGGEEICELFGSAT